MTTLKSLDNISRKTDVFPKLGYGLFWLALFVASLGVGKNAHAAVECTANNTIMADVVVLDNPTVFNRLGAQNPNWITYALRRDVVYVDWGNPTDGDHLKPLTQVNKPASALLGHVELRPDKRPRPIVVRGVAGQCLKVKFQNLLTPVANMRDPLIQERLRVNCADPAVAAENPACLLDNNDQVAGRCAGFHATGTELVGSMADDGSMVGKNDTGGKIGPTDNGQANCGEGMVEPGASHTYNLFTPHEGAFIINSYGATLGSEASGGNLAVGMFGALNVEPCGKIDAQGACVAGKAARIYRSQVTEEEMRLATTKTLAGDCNGAPGEIAGKSCNPGGQPVIDYHAVYPHVSPWTVEGKAGLPVISMVCTDEVLANPGATCTKGELLHTDINAIIAGPNPDGSFPPSTYPLESKGFVNPQLPNRLEAFREFTSQFHDEQTNSQVFPNWYNDPIMRHVIHGVKDQFMINYGSGGIGSEIIANRLRTGPMHDCTDCAYEEFFLASQTVGDPALLVNFPANTGIEACSPRNIAAGPGDPQACWRKAGLANGPIEGNFALYQEDPSNVHNAYSGDFVKMRNTHAGAFEQHIFHFHNHQWLFNPNDDNANYLDAQEIMPGSGHTYELVNGGAGNRNHTVGDAIFHCHFYPHFAQGMWYHMRNHDTFEKGTVLAVSGGTADNPGFHAGLDPVTNKPTWGLRSGQPAAGSRAYPDGELPDGSPIPAVVPLPGKPMPQMPAKVELVAVDRGANSLLGGRTPPDGIPDSSQAVIDYVDAAGPDGLFGTEDDKSPGFPFWLAGNECGIDLNDAAIPPDRVVGHAACPKGIVGQRMPTPPLDMLTEAGAMANAGNPNKPGSGSDQEVDWSKLGGGWDGGLPRHALLGYTAGGSSVDTQNRLDFRKVVHMAQPVFFPELGTDMEKVSMAYQAVRHRPSVAYDRFGNPIQGTNPGARMFVLNGAPPVPGGPYNDPCVDDRGNQLKSGAAGEWYDSDLPGPGEDRWTTLGLRGSSPYDAANPRTYKLANLQIDAVFNKLGHHYSQERIIILWEDITPTVLKDRPPEPLVMRFNTFDCGKLLHANLVPSEFEVDDFQVRTPTDIIGQHIHLPKWDLTTNDGAANGWNYEDGTLSPMMVEERIHAINHYNEYVEACHADATKCVIPAGDPVLHNLGPIDLTGLETVATLTDSEGADPGAESEKGSTHLTPLNHYSSAIADPSNPQFGVGMYLAARTTIQRILVDPVVNTSLVDRGLGLTFSHDHYGPSTFQQIGLYSTILAEPAGSKWVHNESGVPLNTRHDGGPTTWQAVIKTGEDGRYVDNVGGANVPAHREFYFEMSDFQHAYNLGTFVGSDKFGIPDKCRGGEGCLDPVGEIKVTPTGASIFDATQARAMAIEQTWKEVVNPTLKTEAHVFPDVVTAKGGCPGPLGNFDPNVPRPCAEAINIGHSSTWVINYRNEPVGWRVFDPNKKGPDGQNGSQADGRAGDLALAFSSSINRAVPQMNTRFGDTPEGYRKASYCEGTGQGDLINCDRGSGDPFTPIMRTYEGDEVKVKIQVGATEEQHQTTLHGIKWLSNGSGFGRSPNSGWRNFQSHGISEQFSLQAPYNPSLRQAGQTVDYLYATDATRPGMWLGTWGILRTYGKERTDLVPLPNNDISKSIQFVNARDFNGVCPKSAPVKSFDIVAVLANEVLPKNEIDMLTIDPDTGDATIGGDGFADIRIPANTPIYDSNGNFIGADSDGDGIGDNVGGPLNINGGTLVYNRRATIVPDAPNPDGPGVLTGGSGPLHDPTAMMYVLNEDLIPVVEYEALHVEPSKYPSCVKSGGGKGKKAQSGDGPSFDPTLPGCVEEAQLVAKGCMLGGTYKSDLATCASMLRPQAPVEPLVLRANAGDCIEVQLRNKLVTRQGVTRDTGEKVFYGDGRPAMHDDGKGDTYYAGSATGRQVYLDNIEFFGPPDLAGWQDMMWGVTRRIQPGVNPGNLPGVPAGVPDNRFDELHFFNNNLIRPSGYAGLHPQLVEYDASRDDGLWVGQNQPQIGNPGGAMTARYYAGHLEYVPEQDSRQNRRSVSIVATPIEFGGSNLLSADRVKQPQKGLFGALVIEPKDATYGVDTDVPDGQGSGIATRETRAQMTITAPEGQYGESGGTYRESIAMAHKIANLRWADGSAIQNIHQQELGVEGAEDSGHAGFNYGMEPSWFRFKLPPNAPFGAAKRNANGNPVVDGTFGTIPNPQALYANNLVKGEPNAIPAIGGVSSAGDPQTPVFRAPVAGATAGATRIHVLNGASADRDSTFILHGHVWQRDPFVCPNENRHGLPGLCNLDSIGSLALGKNPIGKYMGGEEGMGHVYGHWPILFDAGGTNDVAGDYLFRDYTPSGNRNGMFGILRAE